MAKISPVAAKYIVHTSIFIDGVVDKPDVIGAIFGQTEGLLGNDLELRELQRSGRIGRIEVNTNIAGGKTQGEIIIPSSMDKTETAIIAAALEIIQRIGPCNAKIEVQKIEDVRVSKRQFVIERAKALLKKLTEETLPDSQELADEVSQSVRMMEALEYGPEKLAAGPAIDEGEEIIIVEGRADVLNLLKHGFKNAIAINGTSVPQTIKELAKKKNCTVFVDGDRGGDLIIRELLSTTEIDFVCKAPDGKEVEEITQKEIHKSLRGRITAEQAKLDMGIDEHGALRESGEKKPEFNNNGSGNSNDRRPQFRREDRSTNSTRGQSSFQRPISTAGAAPRMDSRSESRVESRPVSSPRESKRLTPEEKQIFKETMDNLFGTRGACLFDASLNILGKVPLSELITTIQSLNGGIYALALDGAVDVDLVKICEKIGVTHVVGTGNKVKEPSRVNIITDDKLVN